MNIQSDSSLLALPREIILEILHHVPVEALFQSVRYVSRELRDLFDCLVWSSTYQVKLLQELRLHFYWQTQFIQRGERTVCRPSPLFMPAIEFCNGTPNRDLHHMPLRITSLYPQGKEVEFSVWHNGHYRPLTTLSAKWQWTEENSSAKEECFQKLALVERLGFDNSETTMTTTCGHYEAELDLEEVIHHLQQSKINNPRLYEYAEQGATDPNFRGDPVNPHWTDQYMAGFSPHPNTYGFVWAEYHRKYGRKSRDAEKVRGWIRYNRFMMRQLKEDGVWKIGRTNCSNCIEHRDPHQCQCFDAL